MTHNLDSVLVIGAGGNGASLAFHLAALGREVTVVDRREPGTQTSPRAAGIGMIAHSNDATGALGRISIQMLKQFPQDTGEALRIWRSGSLKIARSPLLADKVRAEVESLSAEGFAAEMITADRAHTLAPFLGDLSDARAISWTPDDVQFEPSDLPRAYLRAAKRRGATIYGNTEVRAIERTSHGGYRVTTNAGAMVAAQVVVAAGGWTPRIAAMLDAHIPVMPVRHQLGVTNPIAGTDLTQPTVRIIDSNAYLRPYEGGLIFGAYEPDPVFVDIEHEPAAYDISNVPADRERLNASAREVADMVPGVLAAGFRELRPGIPTLTSDGKYVIDELPEAPGVWVVTGCCVTGLHTAPATGMLVAQWMTDPEAGCPDELAPFSVSRFGPELRNREALEAAARDAYEHKYQTFEEVNE